MASARVILPFVLKVEIPSLVVELQDYSSCVIERSRVLGTRCGTPRYHEPLVKFEDAEVDSPAVDLVNARSAILGSACGTPRRSGPVIHFASASGISSSVPPLEDRQRVLGTRCGTPRRSRPLISFHPSSAGDPVQGFGDKSSHVSSTSRRLPSPVRTNVVLNTASLSAPAPAKPEPLSAPRVSWSSCAIPNASSPSATGSAERRAEILGCRHGTPKRERQLLRLSSSELSAQRDMLEVHV